jgi:hypothetical protein
VKIAVLWDVVSFALADGYLSMRLCGGIFQNTVVFIVAAV